MASAAYAAEDEIVGHQWVEKPLVLPRLDPSVYRNVRVGKQEGVGGWVQEHLHRRRGQESGIGEYGQIK